MFDTAKPLGFLLLLFGGRLDRARSERGASAIEWVIIAAVVVGIVIAVGAVLTQAIEGKADEVGDQIDGA